MYLLCRRLPVFVAVDAVVGLAICSDFVYYYFFVLLPSTSLSVPSFSSLDFFSILPAKSISITCESWCVPSSASIHSHRRLIEWSRMRFTFRRKHTHRYALSLPTTKVEMAQRHNAPIVLFSFSSRSNCIRESKNVGIIAFAFYTLYSPVELHREVHAVNSFFNRSTKIK